VKGVLYLSIRHALHHWGRSLILALCIGVTLFLPAFSRVVIGRYERSMTARAHSTPFVVGARGNRFDLVLSGLYFRRAAFEPMRMGDYNKLFDRDDSASAGIVTPMNVRFTARGLPVVATTIEYFEQRRLALADGTLPAMMGEAVLGARAARELRLGRGDHVFSDQLDSFDISKPPSLKMRVVGVFTETNTPDDHAVFVELKTAWILEGLAHGHMDAESKIPDRLLLERRDGSVVISGEMIEYNEVTAQNLAGFHLHADEDSLPVSVAVYFPASTKAGTITRARANVSPNLQMVSASEVIVELMSYVFRVRTLLDGLFALMATCTGLLVALIALLTARIREKEFQTLHRLGCGRSLAAQMLGAELLMIGGAGVAIASGLLCVVLVSMPDATRVIG